MLEFQIPASGVQHESPKRGAEYTQTLKTRLPLKREREKSLGLIWPSPHANYCRQNKIHCSYISTFMPIPAQTKNKHNMLIIHILFFDQAVSQNL
jgi:hypothetical protein